MLLLPLLLPLLPLLPVPTVDIGFEVVFEAIILKFGKVGAPSAFWRSTQYRVVPGWIVRWSGDRFRNLSLCAEGKSSPHRGTTFPTFFFLTLPEPQRGLRRSGGRFSLICFLFQEHFLPIRDQRNVCRHLKQLLTVSPREGGTTTRQTHTRTHAPTNA